MNTSTVDAPAVHTSALDVESDEQRRQREADELIGKYERLATVTAAAAARFKHRASELNAIAHHWRKGAERLKARYARQVFDKESIQ